MKYAWGAGGLMVAASAVVAQNPDCYEEKGNWYCNEVGAISYSNFGTAGQYQKVTQMGPNGECTFADQSYHGGMAPMDGEVSWHFRGPIHLKQFAFYTSGSSETKRSIHPPPIQRRHAHQQLHHHHHNHAAREVHDEDMDIVGEKRAVGDVVIATINGKVVTWTNEYDGSAPATAATAAPAAEEAVTLATAVYGSPTAAPSMNVGPGQWGRQAYYNAEQGIADGLVFLNHHGGQGSGVFDTVWGMSLSYASADNSAGSPSPVTLADTLIGDNSEFVLMTDKPCSDGGCGTVRDGTVAYHGFDGASKLFLLDFSMPLSGATGFNADMPAAWMLNAQIPRTLQYGKCSCWDSGCGEFDVFEVLDSGNQKCKSTWHGVHSLGDSNWFPRPISGTKKVAVLFDGSSSTAHIIVLRDDTNFDASIAESTVAGFLNSISDPKLHIKVALAG
ncbi:uncharacterized protein Z518_09537 [Rhinocladiella mackenziei CBS 650.93]|uniref:glucan endo-1,3-beta-D-glucosidase n=1 Tax=Rhinocladiella mackenziei CBS 650.93 TaxID=1442369 RepID=A0A0D2IYV1_9EURO|nr:uncharacterized protein Z518_09537 [Rhinocladiella mackenziei CBS 650.93]KIX01810.1 hypothetical protein Z518_09537 [Rhinocladiella mackenziei CBS 650.93]